VLAAAGSMLLLAMTFMPWYRIGPGRIPRSAWHDSPAVLALLLAVVLAGGTLAFALARGLPVQRHTLTSVFGLTLVATIVVVFRLFIDPPASDAPTAIAFGAYPALLAINMVKASAIAKLALARQR